MTASTDALRRALDEIEAAPHGPQVGAFFDFDGTLIAGYSASAMAADRFRRREVGLGDIGRTVGAGFAMATGRADIGDFMRLTAEGWRGRAHDELEELGERLFVQTIEDWVYPEARALVAAHQRRGHTVALTSSATRYQIGAISRELGVDHVLCTELEVAEGLLTGNVLSSLWGEGKAVAVQKFAAEHGVDLSASYFYADGDEDIGLMHLVGKPRPTNPGRRMTAAARRRGWPTIDFSSRGSADVGTRLRSAAGWLSAGPVAAASLAVGLLRRDRRAAVNFATARWLDTMFAATGVEIHVTGEEHLAQRPVVYVVNHRGDLDLLVAAAVVRTDFVALTRPSVADHPVARLLSGLAGTITLTDDDHVAAAADALAPERLSVLAAPERTHGLGERVGPFDPAPFRLARALGVPVVPIVVRNIEALGPRHTRVIRSGVVDVDVLPPVRVDDCGDDELPTRIDEVRNSIRARLDGQPPT